MLKKVILFIVLVVILAVVWIFEYVNKGEKMTRYSMKYEIDTKEYEEAGKYQKKVIHKVVYDSYEVNKASTAYEMDWQAKIIYHWDLKNPDGSFPLSPSPVASKPYTKANSPIVTFTGGVDGGWYIKLDLHSPQTYKNIANIEVYEKYGPGYKGKAAYYCMQEEVFLRKYELMDFGKSNFYIHGSTLEAIVPDKNKHCVYIPLEPSKIIYTKYEKINDSLFEVKYYHKVFKNIEVPKVLSDYGKVFIKNNSGFASVREGVHPSVGKGVWVTYDGIHEMFFQSMDASVYGVDNFVPVNMGINILAGKDGRLLVRVF